jgi:dipeptidyl aminopeptidase/acylaminoacyl peptidase
MSILPQSIADVSGVTSIAKWTALRKPRCRRWRAVLASGCFQKRAGIPSCGRLPRGKEIRVPGTKKKILAGYAINCGIFCLLLISATASALAQSGEGAGFDPTPVALPSPEITSPRAVTSMDLLSILDVHGLSISPDGEHVAFIVGQAVYASNSYRTAMFVVGTAPGSIPVSLGTAGVPHWDEINQWVSEAPHWSPDSLYITYRMRLNDAATWQIWRWSRNGGLPEQLTHADGNIKTYHWDPNGTLIAYTFEPSHGFSEIQELSEHPILYDGNIEAWQCRSVVAEALARQRHNAETRIFELTTGKERRATAEEAKSWARGAAELVEQMKADGQIPKGKTITDAELSPDGKMVAYRYFMNDSKLFPKRRWGVSLRSATKDTPQELVSEAEFISKYWWSRDGSRVYYIENALDGHSPVLMIFPVEGTPRRAFTHSEFLADFSLDSNERYVAFTSQTNTSPPKIALVTLSSGNVRTLIDLNPEFKNIELAAPSRMEGTNAYGDSWWGYVVKPPGYAAGKRYPLIITTYRSGDYFLRGASGDENPIQLYASHGFVVLSFDIGPVRNYRTGDFEDNLLEWSSPVASLEMAIQRLVAMGIIDSDNVGIAGFSHGGTIVGYAVTHTKLFKAAIGAAGYNPDFFYMASNQWRKNFAAWGLDGWPEGESRPKWQALSPVLNADKIQTPLLINSSDSEYVTKLSLVNSLIQLDKPAELLIYANEKHVKNQPKHRYEIYERNLDWFTFWLMGKEDPDPNKHEVYIRWRHLRELQEKARSHHEANPQ